MDRCRRIGWSGRNIPSPILGISVILRISEEMSIREFKLLSQAYMAFVSVIVYHMNLGLSDPKTYAINIFSKKATEYSTEWIWHITVFLYNIIFRFWSSLYIYLFTDFFSSRITYLYENLQSRIACLNVNILRLSIHTFLLLFKRSQAIIFGSFYLVDKKRFVKWHFCFFYWEWTLCI